MHFDWTVTFGAIVVVCGFVGTTVWSTGKIVSRVTFAIGDFQNRLNTHDIWIKRHEECNERQLNALAEIDKRLTQMTEHLAFLRGVSDGQDGEKRHHARRRGDPQ